MILDFPLGSPGESLHLSILCVLCWETVKCLFSAQQFILVLCQLSSLNSSKTAYSILICKIHKYLSIQLRISGESSGAKSPKLPSTESC